MQSSRRSYVARKIISSCCIYRSTHHLTLSFIISPYAKSLPIYLQSSSTESTNHAIPHQHEDLLASKTPLLDNKTCNFSLLSLLSHHSPQIESRVIITTPLKSESPCGPPDLLSGVNSAYNETGFRECFQRNEKSRNSLVLYLGVC